MSTFKSSGIKATPGSLLEEISRTRQNIALSSLLSNSAKENPKEASSLLDELEEEELMQQKALLVIRLRPCMTDSDLEKRLTSPSTKCLIKDQHKDKHREANSASAKRLKRPAESCTFGEWDCESYRKKTRECE